MPSQGVGRGAVIVLAVAPGLCPPCCRSFLVRPARALPW